METTSGSVECFEEKLVLTLIIYDQPKPGRTYESELR